MSLLAALALAAAAYFALARRPSAPTAAAPATAPPPAALPAAVHVGREACAGCHAREQEAWRGSHHDLAMQLPDETSMLGDFDGAEFRHAGVTSRFFRQGGKYFVRTDGPDGELADFEIRWAFGVAPLQQYLIELPGGRIQALGIAWDSRPRSEGGQRWFSLYPQETLRAGDPLHWTGLEQNWNAMCAECHSTDLRKNFDAERSSFATAFTEIDVSCEACHGPGSNHVAWAGRKEDSKELDREKGLVISLDERRDVTWTIDPATGNASRSRARETAREVDLCGRCHARAAKISDDYVHGAPLLDTHRVALLEDGYTWVDGQMRDEIYNYGPFLQSRMFAEGVTCSDCHEPHSLKLREPGDGVCGQCHLPAKYAAPEHHFHPAGSAGAGCAACHMPIVTYMQIDPRHDHSLRIPRPDRSSALGTPNACNACHPKQSPEWAAAEIRKRHPAPKPGFQGFAEAFHAAAAGEPGSEQALIELAQSLEQPPIVRASAIARLPRPPGSAAAAALAAALADPDPMLRAAAAEAARDLDPALRMRLLSGVLGDPVRSVRIQAARALAPLPRTGLSGAQRAALEQGIAEWIAVQEFNADRPESHANLGALRAERGESEPALADFATALAIAPHFTPAAVNRADLLRALGREPEAETSLREAIARNPGDALLHHVLGLSLVRQGRRDEALRELGEAVRLAPADARLAYVRAVALHDLGRKREAIQALETALRSSPNDRDLLLALASYLDEAGETERALPSARRLLELEPGNPQARELLSRLEARRSGGGAS